MNPGLTPQGRQRGDPRLPRKEEGVAGERGWARVAQVRKRRSGRETSRAARGRVEVRGFPSHAQTSAGKWPAPGPGLGDERASRGRPGHPARGRSSGAAPGSRGLGGWGLLARCGKRRPGRSPAPAGAAPGCAPLFRAPGRTSRPLGAEPSRGSPKARRARRRPGPGAGCRAGPPRAGRAPRPRPGPGLGPETPHDPRARRACLAPRSAASGPSLPGARDGREQQPGAPRPRARRGQGRRPGVERTAARAAPTLPSESGVEHSASLSRANEEDSHGNSTTYLRARNGGASLPAPLTPGARPQLRRAGEPGVGRRSGLRGLHPEGHHSPPRPATHPAAGRRPGRGSPVAPCPIVGGTERGPCPFGPVCTFTSF